MLTHGGRNPTYGTMMTLDLWGVVVNVMIYKKFGLDRRRGNRSARGRFRRIIIICECENSRNCTRRVRGRNLSHFSFWVFYGL